MPRSSDQTRPDILQAAYKLFRRRGFFRVGMDEISSAAGVTKRTLYYHFDSKDALLTAVLASQHERAFAEFQTYGIDLSGGPEQLVDKLFGGLAKWSAKPRWRGRDLPGWQSSLPISPAIRHARWRVGTKP
ncbi:TetR/AcrR family transcriptional regulator [Mesorhizobium newzealandense]|uniref:TetR/AcrR family transcriptional regulator n=1 Tax=Mesorhizobium newzealandense TaxID=1300302 RepID=A0ABW4UEH6_9HYPH